MRPTTDDGADFDFFVVFDEFAVGQELVAADDHGGVGEDAELDEEATDHATPGDLDRAPLGMKVDPHARPVGYHGFAPPTSTTTNSASVLDTAGVRL